MVHSRSVLRKSIEIQAVRRVVTLGSVPIPLWKRSKQDQAVAEKEAAQRAARQSAADLEGRLVARVDQAFAEASAMRRQITLLDTGLVPEARMSLESALAGYAAGKVDFITLLDNQSTLYQLQLKRAELKADYLKALAELDMLTGKPVDEILKGVES